MGTVLEIVASVLSSGVGVALLVGFSIRHRVRNSNRLVTGRASAAPASWLWSPRRAAVLHRRLRACCQMALQAASATAGPAVRTSRWRRSPAAVPGPFERIAAEMIAQAVDLDARLVLADQRAGYLRRQAIAGLAGEVRRLEFSSHRMEGLARTWRGQMGDARPPTSLEVTDQLDALEAALGELRNPSGTLGAPG